MVNLSKRLELEQIDKMLEQLLVEQAMNRQSTQEAPCPF